MVDLVTYCISFFVCYSAVFLYCFQNASVNNDMLFYVFFVLLFDLVSLVGSRTMNPISYLCFYDLMVSLKLMRRYIETV